MYKVSQKNDWPMAWKGWFRVSWWGVQVAIFGQEVGSWLLLQNNATLWPKLQAETIDIPLRLSVVRQSKVKIGPHAHPIGLPQSQNIKAIEYKI